MACHRSRSLGVDARISRRCTSLASICHCSRNRPICLTPITNPSPTPYRANPVPPQIYRITLRISPWLWFRTLLRVPVNLGLSHRHTSLHHISHCRPPFYALYPHLSGISLDGILPAPFAWSVWTATEFPSAIATSKGVAPASVFASIFAPASSITTTVSLAGRFSRTI